jgi:hypothetical protein
MIKKTIISEKSIYYGELKMPKGFQIEQDELVKNITLSNYYENVSYPFSITFDKIKTFICDFMRVEHKYDLFTTKAFGNFYERNETSNPKLEIDVKNLNESADFVLLYGVEIDPKTCEIFIYYDDNKRKGKVFKFNLEKNNFIMFPSSQLYYVKNNKNSYLNFVQTILFKY